MKKLNQIKLFASYELTLRETIIMHSENYYALRRFITEYQSTHNLDCIVHLLFGRTGQHLIY